MKKSLFMSAKKSLIHQDPNALMGIINSGFKNKHKTPNRNVVDCLSILLQYYIVVVCLFVLFVMDRGFILEMNMLRLVECSN